MSRSRILKHIPWLCTCCSLPDHLPISQQEKLGDRSEGAERSSAGLRESRLLASCLLPGSGRRFQDLGSLPPRPPLLWVSRPHKAGSGAALPLARGAVAQTHT